jgi:hypothetical protein
MKDADTESVGKKMGRPRKPQGERVSRTLAVRVTYAEEMALRRKAKDAGKKLTVYHRDLIRRDIQP